MKVVAGVLLGLMLWLSGPEFGWWLLAPVSLFGITLILRRSPRLDRSQMFVIAGYSLGWAIPTFYWLSTVTFRITLLPVLAWWLCAFTVAVASSLALIGCHLLLRRGWLAAVALPTLWVIFEWGVDLTAKRFLATTGEGIRLAVTQVGSGLFDTTARLGGAALVTWTTAAAAGLTVDLLTARRQPRRVHGLQGLVFVTVVGMVIWAKCLTSSTEGRAFVVAVVPKSVANPAALASTHESILRAAKVDLVIWPEAALTNTLITASELDSAIDGCSEDIPVRFVIGSNRFTTSALYNSALLIEKNRLCGYVDKRNPAPIFEGGSAISRLFGIRSDNPEFDRGRTSNVLVCEAKTNLSIGVIICHDMLFPDVVQEARASAFLVHMSSEGQARSSDIKRRATACAALRAIETGRTVVRCTLNGESSVIDPTGVATLIGSEYLTNGEFAIRQISGRTIETLYSRWGGYPVVFLVVVFPMAMILASANKPAQWRVGTLHLLVNDPLRCPMAANDESWHCGVRPAPLLRWSNFWLSWQSSESCVPFCFPLCSRRGKLPDARSVGIN